MIVLSVCSLLASFYDDVVSPSDFSESMVLDGQDVSYTEAHVFGEVYDSW